MHDPSLHLFIDDHHIRNAFAMKRKFFPLEQDHNAVLTDIDSRYIGWASAMYENNKYRLWYHSVARGVGHDLAALGVYGKGDEIGFFPERDPSGLAIPPAKGSVCSYAESEDGIHWT